MTPRAGRGGLLLVMAASAVCIGVLVFVFRDPLLRSLSLPLAYIVWALRVAAMTVGQRIAWAAVVLVFAVLAIGSLRAVQPANRRASHAASYRAEGFRSRLASWDRLLSQDLGNWSARQATVFELRRLVLFTLVHTDGGTIDDLERRIVSGQIDVPACVRDLFMQESGHDTRRRARRIRISLPPLPVADVVAALEMRLGTGEERDSPR